MDLYPGDKPSMKNAYQSNYLETVSNDVFEKSVELYSKSKTPLKSGVVPLPANSSMFNPREVNKEKNSKVSQLSGESIDVKTFKHNNMVPFIKGNVTQNTERFTQQLDKYTGNDSMYLKKKEVESFNKPSIGLTNINGALSSVNFQRQRMNITDIQNNITPFEQIRVGPGLNKGYTSAGSGGFQQNNTNDYTRPKSLDDMRARSNQRTSYFDIDYTAPATATEQRGIFNPLQKNKPETTYEQGEENWFKTGANVSKDTARSEIALKKVYKEKTHVEYAGGAKSENVPGPAYSDDHGLKNIIIYDNERKETQTRTVVSNTTSIIKAMISPILDALKISTKEYLTDAPRPDGGNTAAQIPNKMAVHDDIMKTTVKETTVHDSENVNLTGPDGTYSALHDVAKTTVKETLVHDGDILNIKTTKSQYMKNDDIAKTTIKETLPYEDTMRNIGTKTYKVCVYNPIVVKRTVKETTIKGNNELGFIGGLINSMLGGYATSDVEVKNTHKQFTVDNEEYGIAKAIGEHRQVSREAEENMEFDPTREEQLIAAGHTPNPSGRNIPVDKEDIHIETNKLVSDSYSQRESGNINYIYQQPPNIDGCFVPKIEKQNAYTNRLDGNIMSPSQTNDLRININPIIATMI